MIIKRCKAEHYQTLKHIFRRVYSSNPNLQKFRYFNWQFKENPYNSDGEYTLWILEDSSEIKGFYGWIPVEVLTEKTLACEPILWWTAKDSKGFGIELLSKIVQNSSICLFHGCTSQSLDIFKHFRFQIFPLKRLIGVIDLDAVEHLFKIQRSLNSMSILQEFDPISYDINTSRVNKINRFDNNEEMTFKNFSTITARLKYSSDFLNWRYVDIPDSSYQIIRGEREGEYCIYRLEKIKNYDFSVLRIIEWSFGIDTANEAIAFLIKESNYNKVILIDFFCSSVEIGNLFKQRNFGCSTDNIYNNIPYLFRPIKCTSNPMTALYCNNNHYIDNNYWYITKGNSDLDRVKF